MGCMGTIEARRCSFLQLIVENFELHGDAGKSLSEGVVNFARKAVSFAEHSGKLGTRNFSGMCGLAQAGAGLEPHDT